ncbi:MAG: hypothetical protein HFG00_06995 [Oscillibacter sp.]|nr:hypothetical protein [Oscillibacter sp.]
MLKLLGSLCITCGGALAWYQQWAERRLRRETLADLLRVFRRMREEVRMARTTLPVLLETLAPDCGRAVSAFLETVCAAVHRGDSLTEVWRMAADALPVQPGDKSLVMSLGKDLQGDEEKVCKALLHVTYALEKSAGEAENRRPEEEKRATALWFSAAALLVILLI